MNNQFSVVSFNMKNATFLLSNKSVSAFDNRKSSIANYINDLNPMCIGLQEFTNKMKDQIMPLLINYEVVGKNRYLDDHHPFNEQTAILVNTDKCELVNYDTFWLSLTPNTASRIKTSVFPRTCTMATLLIKETNKSIRIYNTHLDFLLPFARSKQIELLINYINIYQKNDPIPFMIMGDFNANYKSSVIKKMNVNYYSCDYPLYNVIKKIAKDQLSNTYHGLSGKVNNKKTPIDYIFVSEEIIVDEAHIYNEENGVPLSDHFPLIAKMHLT